MDFKNINTDLSESKLIKGFFLFFLFIFLSHYMYQTLDVFFSDVNQELIVNVGDFDSEEENEDTNDVSDLSILEKEESLRPVIIENLKNFSKNFKKYQKIRSDYIESKTLNKKVDLKVMSKIRNSEQNISDLICGLFINQSRIDEVVEKHKSFNFRIFTLTNRLSSISKKLKINF